MEPQARRKYLRLQTLRLIVVYICTGDLPARHDCLNFDIDNNGLRQIQKQLPEQLIDPPPTLEEIKAQCDCFEQHISAVTTSRDIDTPESAKFSWLLNVVIIFLASRSGTITRELREPIHFPLCDACNYLNRRPNFDIKIYELGSMIVAWERTLSQSCNELGKASCDSGTSRALPDLVTYLGICTSPLHPSARTRLHPSYVHFHNQFLQFYPREVSTDTIKLESPFPQADIQPTPTRQKTHELGNGLQVKEYSPSGWGDDQVRQLGILVWCAGGGWALGDTESDNAVLSQICEWSSCWVFNVSYRREPFPAPLEDVLRAVHWVQEYTGGERFVVGGVSAGGLLAAVAALEMSSNGMPPLGLLLVASSLDNGPDCRLRWAAHANAPWLSPEKMAFYQDRYLSSDKDRSIENWRASPIHAPPETMALARKFPTYIAAMGVDILKEESMAFAERLRKQQCPVTLHQFADYPHMAFAMQGVLGTSLLIKVMSWLEKMWSGESTQEGEEDVLEMRV